jgi:3-hydroxyacyl-CoA dehydrogenase
LKVYRYRYRYRYRYASLIVIKSNETKQNKTKQNETKKMIKCFSKYIQASTVNKYQPSFRSFSRSVSSPLSSQSPTFDSVGVVGLGLMGHGICQTAATASVSSSSSPIIAYEPELEYLKKGEERITNSLSRMVSREKITQDDADQILNNITFTTDIQQLSNSDFIIEAVIENIDLKNELYTSLDKVCKESTIFASNTSSLSITDMAEIMPNRLPQFLGVHFFNPVQVMKLVEVIHTKYTDPAVFDKVYGWVENDIGKVPVKCGDTPGFIVNRLLVPSLMQAMLMVDRNDASVKDIDLSMKLGAGHPMGPLHLADYIGLDTCLFIVEGWVKT